MTAVSISYQQRSPLMSILIAAIIIAMAAVSMHALTKHGQSAITATQCVDYPDLRMVNPTTGRIASICITEDGWGITITEADGQPVTSFLKEKAKTLQDVIRYLRNAGYKLMQ